MKPFCVVSSPVDTFSGYGHRSRDFVRSLIEAKGDEWDIYLLPQMWGNTPWGFLDKNDPLRSRFIQNLSKKPFVNQNEGYITMNNVKKILNKKK